MKISSDNPYLNMPNRSFWSRAVSTGWNPRDLSPMGEPILRRGDKVMSAGSCFAANIIPFLEAAGYAYIRTERAIDNSIDRFGYCRYSAAYGNIYTARQFLQLLQRASGKFRPVEDRWILDDRIIDPFRPGLPYPAESEEEYDLLTSSHLERVREAVLGADVLIFTLGLTESWVSAADGAVFPACPGTVAGKFDPSRHLFKNFKPSEVSHDLDIAVSAARAINPKLRVVLTVSPVPLVATATGAHILCASSYSKSVLRVACEEVAHSHKDVTYFPALELITGPQAPDYFDEDRRHVSNEGVKVVMDALFSCSQLPDGPLTQPMRKQSSFRSASALSEALGRLECEEMMIDPDLDNKQ